MKEKSAAGNTYRRWPKKIPRRQVAGLFPQLIPVTRNIEHVLGSCFGGRPGVGKNDDNGPFSSIIGLGYNSDYLF
jgi:hypothetical protein